MDRTAGNPNWMVIKPFVSQTSNCVLPTSVVNKLLSTWRNVAGGNNSTSAGGDPNTNPGQFTFYNDSEPFELVCFITYTDGFDPGYLLGLNTGFNPATAPNNGEGFDKNRSAATSFPTRRRSRSPLGAQCPDAAERQTGRRTLTHRWLRNSSTRSPACTASKRL